MYIASEIILEILSYLNFSDYFSLLKSGLFINFNFNLLKYTNNEIKTVRDYKNFKKYFKFIKNLDIYIENMIFSRIIINKLFFKELKLFYLKTNIILTNENYNELLKLNKINFIYNDYKNKSKINLKKKLYFK